MAKRVRLEEMSADELRAYHQKLLDDPKSRNTERGARYEYKINVQRKLGAIVHILRERHGEELNEETDETK